MTFNFAQWAKKMLEAGSGPVDHDALLEAAGLTGPDICKEDIASLLREIEADLDDPKRKARGCPLGDGSI